jgi:hypothetical protein
VVERLAPAARGFNRQGKLILELELPDEFIKRLRAEILLEARFILAGFAANQSPIGARGHA